MEVTKEIKFKTARSGGKGGQNVNKVETMVEGYFHVYNSALLTSEEKLIVTEKLANKITDEGFLQIKNQTERSQLANKDLVVKKMNALISRALIIPKKRKPTKPSKASKERRIESKKKNAETKQNRKKLQF